MIKNTQPSEYRFSLADPDMSRIEAPASPARGLVAGDLCPACEKEYLDYDGLLNLVCKSCGYGEGGCFT
jgi:hypothetical protein